MKVGDFFWNTQYNYLSKISYISFDYGKPFYSYNDLIGAHGGGCTGDAFREIHTPLNKILKILTGIKHES